MLRSILALICLCAACSPAAAITPVATAMPAATSTIQPSELPVTPSPQPSDTPEPQPQSYAYKVIYTDGSFSIRQAFLGTDAIWNSAFRLPAARIENSAAGLGLGRDMACDTKAGVSTHCSQTIEITLDEGAIDKYVLGLASPTGGTGTLFKNGRLIWSGTTNGANSFAILSSIRVGNEIALDYSKSNWGSNESPLWITPSILLSQGNAVKLIPDAFAPQSIRSKLAYFKIYNRKETLIFDGKPLGDTYDEIFNLQCCWHGPAIGIAGNGEMIDFFAQKGSDWYHVQAGYLPKEP